MATFSEVHAFLAGALTRFPWRVVISGREGRSYAIGGSREHWCGKPLAIRFNTEEALNAVLSLDGMRVLEGFVRGDVEMNGNLYALGYLGDYLDLGMSKARLLAFLVKHRLFQSVRRARLNVRSHYDIPQAVLAAYLDKTYLSYSCAMFEHPDCCRVEELTTPGHGRRDTFDSLEKAQWRKFKDAVDFIDPRSGETLLDVGCGYGGQLAVALELYSFGQVVGCTHSHNQVVFGRRLLAAFDPGLWELRETDYREDDRVFDHVTSTGMISHVGPRGLVPYVRDVRRRIKTGGRYVHHALMAPYRARPLEASAGIAFNKTYVWPGFHWFTFGEHVRALETNGFHVRRAVDLSRHYAKTTAAWYERFTKSKDEILCLLNGETYRGWQIYLAGNSGSFLTNRSQVYRLYCEAI